MTNDSLDQASQVGPGGTRSPNGADAVVEAFRSAMARASRAGTPDAWQEAVRAVTLVAEMACTIQLAVSARDTAARMTQAVQEAERRAQAARDSARHAVLVAQEAADNAAVAVGNAGVAVQAVPELEKAANDAARIAADAKLAVAEIQRAAGLVRPYASFDEWSSVHPGSTG